MVEKESQQKVKVRTITWVGLIIFSLACLVFAYLQRMNADRMGALAEGYHEQWQLAESQAQKNAEEALMQRAMAEQQMVMAKSALEECDKSKKN